MRLLALSFTACGCARLREQDAMLRSRLEVVLVGDFDLVVELVDLALDRPRLRHLVGLGGRRAGGACGRNKRNHKQ